jgi:hypothetical protein
LRVLKADLDICVEPVDSKWCNLTLPKEPKMIMSKSSDYDSIQTAATQVVYAK